MLQHLVTNAPDTIGTLLNNKDPIGEKLFPRHIYITEQTIKNRGVIVGRSLLVFNVQQSSSSGNVSAAGWLAKNRDGTR